MPGYYGEAWIIQGDRDIAVTCSLEVRQDPRSGLGEWSGGYQEAQPSVELSSGAAKIRLPNGREGDIIITRAVLGSGHGQFTGSGPAPL